MKRLRKFCSLTHRQRMLLIGGWTLLIGIRIALRVVRFQRILQLLSRPSIRHLLNGLTISTSVEHRAWTVKVASRFVPGATCLVQAIALHTLHQSAGCNANLRIGVSGGAGNDFRAHAWVETPGSSATLESEGCVPLLSWNP